MIKTIEKSNIWINESKSKKCITVNISGVYYIANWNDIDRLRRGEIKGVNLGRIIPDEEVEQTELTTE